MSTYKIEPSFNKWLLNNPMAQIRIMHDDARNNFYIEPAQFDQVSPVYQPTIKSLLDDLNGLKERRRASCWFYLASLAVVLLIGSVFLLMVQIYLAAVPAVLLALAVLFCLMFRRARRAFHRKLRQLAVECELRLAGVYIITAIFDTGVASSRTRQAYTVILFSQVRAGETPPRIESAPEEPIPMFTFKPKKNPGEQAIVITEQDLKTQPLTPLAELSKSEGRTRTNTVQSGVPRLPELAIPEADFNNPVFMVGSLPPTPQGQNPPLQALMLMDSVYSIPRRANL